MKKKNKEPICPSCYEGTLDKENKCNVCSYGSKDDFNMEEEVNKIENEAIKKEEKESN